MRRIGQKFLYLTVLIGAGTYLATPITTGVHFLVRPHHFCAEHDTFEHSGVDEGRLSSVGDIVDPLSLVDLEAHQHALCSQAVTSWRDAAERTVAMAWDSAPLPAETASVTHADAAHGLPTLLVAPKNPPPRFGYSVFFV